jgi:RimJ/RimL family protein N-acetyltransferase
MEKCGFKLNGVIEAAYLKYNEMQNRLNYIILKSEYEKVSG